MSDYYERPAITQIDGTRVFKSEEDERNEQKAAAILSAFFSKRGGGECQFRSFGKLSPVDWWVERSDRIVGFAELKCRSHASTTHPTVFLNVRKWLAMKMAAAGFGVPAVFVVRFTDGLFYIPIDEVDVTRHKWRGCSKERDMRSKNDREPLIEVPVSDMYRVDQEEL